LALERCGWEPLVSLRDGLSRVLEYVRENLERYDVDRYTI
jgi:hypothetical protein